MTAQDLKNSILQLAVQGKLVKQDPNDEPASELLKRIRAEKQRLVKEGKIKKDKNPSDIFIGSDKLPYEKRGEETHCIDDEIPFDIPDSWAWCRLGDVCFLLDGEKYEGKPLPYLEAKVLRGLKIPEKRTQGRFVSSGTTIILVDGENSGEVFITNRNGILGSTYKLLVLLESLYKSYILFIIKFYQKLFRENKKGAAIPHLNKSLFHNLLIGIPPVAEQKRIVEKIEELVPLVDVYGERSAELTKLNKNFPDALKKSILQWAVQGKLIDQDPNDEPADILLEKIRAEKEKLIKEGKIKRDKNASKIIRRGNEFYEKFPDGTETLLTDLPFDIPDSWMWCRLGELCSYIQRGKSPIYSLKKEIPVISQKCIQWDGVSLKNAKFIDPLSVYKYNEERFLKSGDLLWNSTGLGTVGRVGVFYTSSFNRIVVDSHVTIARTISKFVDIDYIYSWFSSPEIQFDIEEKADGSTKQKELNLNTIKNFYVPFPPVEEQVRISRQIKILLSIIESD